MTARPVRALLVRGMFQRLSPTDGSARAVTRLVSTAITNWPFATDYFNDPELRLPAGPWRLIATSTFFTGPEICPGERHALEAAIDIVVLP